MAYYNGKKISQVIEKSAVMGVKGNAETSYRTGNVNITPQNIGALVSNDLLSKVYPIGSIYMSTNSTSPASFLGGSWTRIQDRFLLASGSTYSVGSTGGSATHTLTTDEMPTHEHTIPYSEDGQNQGWQQSGYIYITGRTDNTKSDGCWFYSDPMGGNMPHNNMPPYLAVYVWKRTA